MVESDVELDYRRSCFKSKEDAEGFDKERGYGLTYMLNECNAMKLNIYVK